MDEKPGSSNSWKIASYISFVVIVGLIVLNIIPRGAHLQETEILDKSIAVLPFHNDSPNQENEYFINGTMESILSNLCKIKDLRVISRSSVERYRDTAVLIPQIAKELMVSYILEGSMQKYGDHIRLTLQLIDQNDKHIWAEQYDREILEDFTNREEEGTSLSFAKAVLLAELDEPDSAMYWLQKAYEEKNQLIFYIGSLKAMFSSMDSDPRLIRILNNLPRGE